MLLFVTLVSESRLNTNDLLDCYSHCKCLIGRGKRLPWILSWDCQELSKIQFHLGNCGSTDQVAHFIPVKTTYSGPQLAELYMSWIFCLHGVPQKIVSDRGMQFTSRFWERLHETLDTQLHFSSTYHP
jgi:hypothetical protein